jgi:hypothetical protein
MGGAERFSVKTNGNVGIGTTSPGAVLEVLGDVRFAEGANYNGFFYDATNARLGLGTAAPGAKLHIAGTDYTATSLSEVWNTPIARFRIDSGTNDGYLLITDVSGGVTPSLQAASGASTARNLVLNPYGGNVGIGHRDGGAESVIRCDWKY